MPAFHAPVKNCTSTAPADLLVPGSTEDKLNESLWEPLAAQECIIYWKQTTYLCEIYIVGG